MATLALLIGLATRASSAATIGTAAATSVSTNTITATPSLSAVSYSYTFTVTTSTTAPTPLLEIRTIKDEKHSAAGQRGLFATQHLGPDSFICLYLGHVHTNTMSDEDAHSDCDLSLDHDIGLNVDAARSGNESRYTNDYRGIAERPNAEFRDCYVQVPCTKRVAGTSWERRVISLCSLLARLGSGWLGLRLERRCW
ncbi:hypothetical protein LTR54_018258 [Friedmanniomyces endolithicus]|nr:hypothetical protein LTR54_018258 [Friedmanniomyces endolithicus]